MEKKCEICKNRSPETFEKCFYMDFPCPYDVAVKSGEYFAGHEIFEFFKERFPQLGNEKTLRAWLPAHCEKRRRATDPFILKCNSAYAIGNPVDCPASLENLTKEQAYNLPVDCDLFNERDIGAVIGYSREWVSTMVYSGSIPTFQPGIGVRPWSSKKWLEPYKKPTDVSGGSL